MRSVSDKSVEKNKTHFKFNNYFPENSACCEKNVEKYGGTGRAAGDNTAHAHCMLNN
jgi:hypothetical protein